MFVKENGIDVSFVNAMRVPLPIQKLQSRNLEQNTEMLTTRTIILAGFTSLYIKTLTPLTHL